MRTQPPAEERVIIIIMHLHHLSQQYHYKHHRSIQRDRRAAQTRVATGYTVCWRWHDGDGMMTQVWVADDFIL